MPSYIIGDVQGCFDDFCHLLKKIKFNPDKDQLIFCGDLVNRGGQSLAVLRWIYAHQYCCKVTLGNHDLALLAQYYLPKMRKFNNYEFQRIFEADDCDLLMRWLLKQKLLIHLKEYNAVIVHAGIYPKWSLKRAKTEAKNVERLLKNNTIKVLSQMYGSKPNHWDENLAGNDRVRFTINSFTRMRFLYKNGGLVFKSKGELEMFPQLLPWFKDKRRKIQDVRVVFGHWSALGFYDKENVTCIDTGKVWGGQLTAITLNKKKQKLKRIFQV